MLNFRNTINYLISSILAIFVALLLISFLLVWQGTNPISAYAALFSGAFQGMGNFGASLVLATPLMLAGLGIALSFRAGIFNIGAEGQLYLGAMAATFVGANLTGLPPLLHITLAFLASMVVGGLWGFIPGYLKIKKGFNEVITSILLNYIGVYFVNYAVSSFLKDPGSFAPQSLPLQPSARLAKFMTGSELNSSIILGLVITIILYIVLYKTDWGFQVRAIGSNREAGRTAGMNTNKVFITAIGISGALAGLAGAVQIMGYQYILLQNFSPNTGYDSIAVALLGNLNPIGTAIAAIFFGALRNGANTMQIIMNIPVTIVYIIQAIIIICILGFSATKIDYISWLRNLQIKLPKKAVNSSGDTTDLSRS